MPRSTITAGTLALASVGNDFAQLTYDAPANGLINGCMEIWQRGTSGLATATSTANGFTADRWQLLRSSFVAGATGSQVAGTGPCRYALRIQRTAGNTALNNITIYQSLETAQAEQYAGQQVTFSAWMRKGADFGSSAFSMRILGGTGTDQNVFAGYTGSTTVVSTSKTLTTSWQRFSVTATVASTITELACGILWTPTGTAGTNDYYEITGAQLEIGPTPSPFQMAGGNIAGELAACQRYFQRHGLVSGAVLATGYGSGTTVTNTAWVLAPQMRIAPSSVAYANMELIDGAGTTFTATAMALSAATPSRTLVQVTHALNDTAHRPYGLRASSGTGYVEFNAEI